MIGLVSAARFQAVCAERDRLAARIDELESWQRIARIDGCGWRQPAEDAKRLLAQALPYVDALRPLERDPLQQVDYSWRTPWLADVRRLLGGGA